MKIGIFLNCIDEIGKIVDIDSQVDIVLKNWNFSKIIVSIDEIGEILDIDS